MSPKKCKTNFFSPQLSVYSQCVPILEKFATSFIKVWWCGDALTNTIELCKFWQQQNKIGFFFKNLSAMTRSSTNTTELCQRLLWAEKITLDEQKYFFWYAAWLFFF